MAGRRRGQGNLDMIGVGPANSCVWVVVGLFFEIVSLGAGVSNSITGLHALQPFHQRRKGPSATSPLRTIFSICHSRVSDCVRAELAQWWSRIASMAKGRGKGRHAGLGTV